jgi:Flp pilus assembly protein TadG
MPKKATNRAGLRGDSGAVAVEFALVLPIFLLLLLGMFDFGKAFNYWIDGTHLSHEAARYAAVGTNPGPGATLAESIRSRADTQELQDAMTVCVSYPDGTDVGDPVQVTVNFDYTFLDYITSMTDLTSVSVENTSTMRLERKPISGAASCAGS